MMSQLAPELINGTCSDKTFDMFIYDLFPKPNTF